jgi:hypothetical protein
MSSKEYISYLPYKSVDLYFIFSFLFDFIGSYEKIVNRLEELGWDQGPPQDRQGRPPFLGIKRRVRVRETKKYLATSLSCQLIKNDDGPWRLFYNEMDHSNSKSNNVNIKDHPDEFEVGMEAWSRLFDNGAGSITFKVSLEDNVNFRRIYEAHSLSQRMYEKEKTYAKLQLKKDKAKNNKTNLFKIFSNLITDLESKINKNENLVGLQDSEVMDLKADDIEAQNPYVLSVIELDDSRDFTQFFKKPSSETPECKELAAILFRLVYPFDFFKNLRCEINNVRIPHELLEDGPYIQNYAWDSRTLMWFSKTSSLFACCDKSIIPAIVIKNSLLDVLEILRTRWHMSILINAQLDLDLENFCPQASSKNLEILEKLNKRRRRFASYLHDPLPYIFEGGSVSEIASVAAEEMQLNELRHMTIEKFATLDKLHADQMKIVQLRDFKSYDRILSKYSQKG